jgi:hypothetical protein
MPNIVPTDKPFAWPSASPQTGRKPEDSPMSPDGIARVAARILIEVKAVHFNAARPYAFASSEARPPSSDRRLLCRYALAFDRKRTEP